MKRYLLSATCLCMVLSAGVGSYMLGHQMGREETIRAAVMSCLMNNGFYFNGVPFACARVQEQQREQWRRS